MRRVRHALLAVLLGAVGLPVAMAASPTAQAAPAERWSVAGQTTITVAGQGYGHGRGMSQYGAEGAARQGLGYREIVEFYYPGTSWGTSRGRVTVLISADTDGDLVVFARPGLRLRDLVAGTTVPLPDNGASRWRIRADADGAVQVGYLSGRRWHRWATLNGEGGFAAGGEPVTLVLPGGETRAYRGQLRSAVTGTGARVTVNAVGLEHYLRGVVPLEIPALWSPAAVQAQAVAARTYASYERRHPKSVAYQLCDTGSCQVYGGYDVEHPAANSAIDATRRQVLTSDGRPAFTQFGSSSGGWTVAGSQPYLPAQRDPYDRWSGNPVRSWSTTVDREAIERAWPALGQLRRIVVQDRDGNGRWGGRVRSLTLIGDAGRVSVSGDAFRSAMALRSTWFTFRVPGR